MWKIAVVIAVMCVSISQAGVTGRVRSKREANVIFKDYFKTMATNQLLSALSGGGTSGLYWNPTSKNLCLNGATASDPIAAAVTALLSANQVVCMGADGSTTVQYATSLRPLGLTADPNMGIVIKDNIATYQAGFTGEVGNLKPSAQVAVSETGAVSVDVGTDGIHTADGGVIGVNAGISQNGSDTAVSGGVSGSNAQGTYETGFNADTSGNVALNGKMNMTMADGTRLDFSQMEVNVTGGHVSLDTAVNVAGHNVALQGNSAGTISGSASGQTAVGDGSVVNHNVAASSDGIVSASVGATINGVGTNINVANDNQGNVNVSVNAAVNTGGAALNPDFAVEKKGENVVVGGGLNVASGGVSNAFTFTGDQNGGAIKTDFTAEILPGLSINPSAGLSMGENGPQANGAVSLNIGGQDIKFNLDANGKPSMDQLSLPDALNAATNFINVMAQQFGR